MDSISVQLYICLSVCIGFVLGSVIGYEREKADKPAGLRTHALVGGASALFMGLSYFSAHVYPSLNGVQIDPLRIIAAIITGVSFLGAGTIFKSVNRKGQGDIVEGLTTAATIWVTAAIGTAAGMHAYIIAFTTTLLTLVLIKLLPRVKDITINSGL